MSAYEAKGTWRRTTPESSTAIKISKYDPSSLKYGFTLASKNGYGDAHKWGFIEGNILRVEGLQVEISCC